MKNYSWERLVRTAEPNLDEPEVVYEFSNGRKFKSTDDTSSGIYTGE